MKILHACETVLGGVGTHLNELIHLQSKTLGADHVSLLGPRQHMSQVPDVLESQTFTYSRPTRLLGLPLFVLALIRAVFLFRPNVIHAHSTFAGFLTRLIAPFMGVPTVYCPHGWAMDRQQPSIVRKAIAFTEKTLSLLSARIVAVSHHERARGIEIGIKPEKIVTVHNGLRPTPPPFTPTVWQDSRLKVVYVGRLDKQKGIDVLLKAIKGLEDKLSVRIVGDVVVGCESFSFADYPHVEPLGWVDISEANAQIAACDVVAMPSRWEGLPIVALEAMRLAKPLIATRVGGIPETVEDGKTGFLFDAEDSATLRELLLSVDPPRCAVMGQAAQRKFNDEFLAVQTYKALFKIYEDACGRKG